MSSGVRRSNARGILQPQSEDTRPLLNHRDHGLVQNFQNARVYVFGEGDIEEEDVFDANVEMSELRSRGGKRKDVETTVKEEESFLEREIADGDTIQSIALQYGCPVAELKRINNLIRDQDFFARKFIKVPIKRHGLLTELVEKENQRNGGQKITLGGANNFDSAITVEDVASDSNSDSETNALLVRTLSIRGALGNQGKEAQKFLKHMDKDLEKIRNSTKTYKNTLEEVATSLTCKRIHPLAPPGKMFNGVDCGMRWWSIVAIMLVIGLLLPLMYFLYFEYGKPPD